MKRVIASVTVATAALLVAAAPAQAAPAPADPVKALKSRLVAGQGVKFTELSTLTSSPS
ncbi:hypothetical protein [Streptosporangium sp. CA-115845]|uniref:hypothetical protein n=1 Tax=Streptosporangium sp. CA-115845 TaxID=3240071 RepID=UPI003D90A6EF